MRRKIAVFSVILAIVLAGAGAQGQPVPQPAASKPIEVKGVSMPANAAPTDVRVISPPPDESGMTLVKSTDRLADATTLLAWLTGGVFLFTAALAGITVSVSKSQSRELARRDKDALAREVNRSAHMLRLNAERTRLLVIAPPGHFSVQLILREISSY